MEAIAALQAINGIAQSLNNQNDSEKQQKYQLELMKKQNEYNQQSVDRQIQGEKELFNYTSYGRKTDQMKNAGLNPGLIYGMGAGGGGGVTGNVSAPGVSGAAAPNVAGARQTRIAEQGMSLQFAKLASEIEVNKSVAEANRAEAEIKTGVETEKKNVEIANILAQTKSEGLKQDAIQIDNAFKRIELKIADRTIEDKISAIESDSSRAYYAMQSAIGEMKSSLAKGTVDVATINTAIEQYNANLSKTITDTLLAQKNTQKSDAEITQIFNKIQQDWQTSQEDIRVKQAEANKIIKELNLSKEQEDQILNMIGKMIPTMLIK